jgi:hypothetical protein
MENLFLPGIRLRPKPRRAPQRAFRFSNAHEKVLPYRLNGLPISKIRAVIKVVKLSPERSNHLMLSGPLVHVTK